MGAAKHTRGAGGRRSRTAGNLMDRAVLDAVWRDGRCSHSKPAVGLYGLCATLSCPDCSTTMQFLLRFGRPKTFRVTMMDGTGRPVGRASVREASEFIFATATVLFLPESDADQAGDSPERDRAMLSILMDTLTGDKGEPLPPIDFEGPWRDIDCPHKSASCQVYSNTLYLECHDCAAELRFTLAGKSGF